MKAAFSKDVGPLLCDALGLDASLVRRLTLHCDVGEVVTVEVELLPSQEQVQAITRTLHALHWTEKPGEPADVTTLADEFRQYQTPVTIDDIQSNRQNSGN